MSKKLQTNKRILSFLWILVFNILGIPVLLSQTVPVGAVNGLFSVREGQQVFFSRGNLQYIGSAATPYWKFADHQWDYLGSAGQNNSSQNVDRDLFGWGTSGYSHGAVCYQPWSTSDNYSDYYAYGNENDDLEDQTGQADWGYNAILNGGNQENSGWRTPANEEWYYLFNNRNTPSGIRYAKAKVNNVNGVILVPDNWSADYYALSNTNTSGASYSSNVITAGQWTTLEQHGAVFLPAAGYRYETYLSNVGSNGRYWSTTPYNSYARRVNFDDSQLVVSGVDMRYYRESIRLICAAQGYVIINVMANPAEGGTVSGAGTCEEGTECTLEATASAGYTFVNWTVNGEVVSTEATYTFTVTEEQIVMANFQSTGFVTGNGALHGNFSVSANQKVNFSQGNLQYIGNAETPYWKFAEHQWDYLGHYSGSSTQGSDSQTANRDLFGWGTSGYNHGANCYQPWSTSTTGSDYYAYGSNNYNLNDHTGQADWGYNPISNGGNQEHSGWRTLTHDEWSYLFNTRTTSSGIRYAKATVSDINGVILLPDDWSASYYSLSNTNSSSANYSSNVISALQWVGLEQHGAVFLPAAGFRNETLVYDDGAGSYWSASYHGSMSNSVFCLQFGDSNLGTDSGNNLTWGFSVRLVRNSIVVISAMANPAEGGSVSGVGTFEARRCT